MKSWFALSLVALMIWGSWGVFANLAARRLGALSALVWEVVGAVLVAVVVVVVTLRGTTLELETRGVMYAMLTGVSYTLGLLFVFLALRAGVPAGTNPGATGRIHTILVVTAMYPMIAAVLNYSLLGEPVTLRQVIGIVLGVGAIVVFTSGGS